MRKAISVLICVFLLFGLSVNVFSETEINIENMLTDTGKFILSSVANPQYGSIGGEWAVLGLAAGKFDVPKGYFENYYKNLEEHVIACKGVLHQRKYTEYSRVILALTAIGKDPSNVAGYNLLTPLGDYQNTIRQGINGPVWALIALDSGNYDMPFNPEAEIQATREMYLDYILSRRLTDGGWALSGEISDPDITGMVLQALSNYQDDERIRIATQEALLCMSKAQDESGGYTNWGEKNAESCIQIIIALCELGISIDDPRFVKNSHSLLDNLMSFYKNGSFAHTLGGESNLMTTEQGLCALVSLKKLSGNENSLYGISDMQAPEIAITHNTKQKAGPYGRFYLSCLYHNKYSTIN